MNPHPLRQGQQLVVELCHHGLVGGDDVLPRQDGVPDVFPGGVQTADGLHHGVDGGIPEDVVEIVGDLSIGEGQIPAAKHPDDLHIRPGSRKFVDTPAHGAESKQTDFHSAHPLFSFVCRDQETIVSL